MNQDKIAFVFPGQGSQEVGMGRAWADSFEASKRTFEEADDALGMRLSELCWQGPEEELNLTANTQPALLATSIAIYRAVKEAGLEAAAMAGHSLGEYSALVAAGALDFGDALRLVRRRGQLMQDAVPVGEGAMAAIIALDVETVSQLAQEAAQDEVCALANLNSEGQTVIAGHRGAVERAVDLARERGARKAVLLTVSAPFHSPLMAPVREALAPLLAETEFRTPRVPMICNVDARPVSSGAEARDALVRQVDATVRWTESVAFMATEGKIESFAEIGHGKVLTGLNRRIARGTKCWSLAKPESLEKALADA
ncbi:MAG: ACP S-malonyltransferase [Deltaproteobacteria bacterium]|nr:ACP S-malonyltransferase [Deltaproteobacteria bacterium]